ARRAARRVGIQLRVELARRAHEAEHRETVQREAGRRDPGFPVHAWHRILTARYNSRPMAGLTEKSKRRVLAGWTFAALLGAAFPALCQTSIGFVSLDRILREAPAAQAAQKKLEKEFSQRGQELARQADQLKKMQESLEKNAVTMTESERVKREREFGDANRDFQRR